MLNPALTYQADALNDTCRRYGVRALSVFGSATRTDFGADSDVDVLVEFDLLATPGLLRMVKMKEELEAVFGHTVDLVTPEILRNPYRRATIARDLERLYAA
jgi:hypothetical protein